MIDVTCAIINIGNKILVTQRSEKMRLPLKWEFPGGKIEQNESAEECLLREIKEELNIDIQVIKKMENSIYNYGDFEINLIPFTAKYVSGEIILSEHKEFRLLGKNELNSLDWAAADLPIVSMLTRSE